MLRKMILLAGCASAVHAEQKTLEMIIPVEKQTPVYNTIVEKVPYEYCYDHKENIQKNGRNNVLGALIGGTIGTQVGGGKGKDVATVAGTVIGSGNKDENAIMSGLIGGAIGSQIGKGKGKQAATVLGALLGTQMGTRRQDTGTNRVERRCETRYRDVSRQVLSGYNHKATFMGQELLKYYPSQLDKLPITIQIQY